MSLFLCHEKRRCLISNTKYYRTQNNCPNLAILVVNQTKKLPGDWYFELYEAMNPGVMYHRRNHIKSQLEKIYSYQDWHVIAERYDLSENLVLQLKLRSLKLKER